MTDFAADVVAMLRGAPNAKDIAFGAERTRGPVDIEDRPESDAGGERLVRRTVAEIPIAALPSLAEMDTVAIDGTHYIVREIAVIGDGTSRELVCAEVTS